TLNQKGYFGKMGLDTEASGTLSRLRSIAPAILEKSSKQIPFWTKVKLSLRHHLDIFDSFKRVREADILNKALVAQQVGLRRAALESKAIIDRQK
ncbi:MAG: hypothetical protein VXZ96_05115, partial [Myxococcota bacterium]|nr:hypothetical protein [Myxococcota bacterium]